MGKAWFWLFKLFPAFVLFRSWQKLSSPHAHAGDHGHVRTMRPMYLCMYYLLTYSRTRGATGNLSRSEPAWLEPSRVMMESPSSDCVSFRSSPLAFLCPIAQDTRGEILCWLERDKLPPDLGRDLKFPTYSTRYPLLFLVVPFAQEYSMMVPLHGLNLSVW